MKKRCKCVVCDAVRLGAWDYRDGAYVFEERPCPVCPYRVQPDAWWYDLCTIDRALFVPDALKHATGHDFMCHACLGYFDRKLHDFGLCWSSADREVVGFITCSVLTMWLAKGIYHEQYQVAHADRIAKDKADIEAMFREWERDTPTETIDIPIVRVRKREDAIPDTAYPRLRKFNIRPKVGMKTKG